MKVRSVNNFINVTKSGLYCAAGDFYLDPRKRVHKAIVTHAHADHAVPNSGNIYCTRNTKNLMLARYGNKVLSRYHLTEYRDTIAFNDVKVTFFSAGHMLGSCQVLMEFEGLRYLYTGDFKTQPDESAGSFDPVAADVLITETTFADPSVKHPDVKEEVERINTISQQIIIGAYAMGKAQRINRLLSNHCRDRAVFVHPQICRFHKVYEEAGVEIGKWQTYRRKEYIDSGNGVFIAPPSELRRYSRSGNVHRMFATGWKKSWFACDSILQISDHADWFDLLDVIDKVKPKQIFTLHGDGTHLKKHLENTAMQVEILDH